ncbi:MAG: glutamate 5-kinase, partial [Anaerovoracaceae bacterium]
EEDNRRLNIRNAMFTLLDEGVVPIINENDSVSVDEIKIGDNDSLAALTVNIWNGDLLVLLSDVDGIFKTDPKSDKNAELVNEIDSIDTIEKKISIGKNSEFGTGGVRTKIEAAKMVAKYEIPTILINGKVENSIVDLQCNNGPGTIFIP